jgi:hypothetical protein
MGFSPKQLRALRREIDDRKIRTRQVHGRELSYIEGWHAIAEANRIFGFDGWTRETVEARCVLNREIRGTFTAVYAAKVRITVFANGRTVVREGHGTGEGQGPSAGETHDIALKAAETDATKRALATFGKPFGLSLYLTDRNRPGAGHERRPLPPPRYRPTPPAAVASPAPGASAEKVPATAASDGGSAQPTEAPPCGPQLIEALQTPQSVLPLGYPRRIRDRNHLKFVTNQLCLKCARWPSDAHHITFAQPRAMGMKVSDEFVVPLCRLHHREVHHARNELAWWKELKIDPVAVANELWRESHARLDKAKTARLAEESQIIGKTAGPQAEEQTQEPKSDDD